MHPTSCIILGEKIIIVTPNKTIINKQKSQGANLGFEEKLWAAADKLRGQIDSAEYKHIVLGLIFLKYISDGLETSDRQTKTFPVFVNLPPSPKSTLIKTP